MKPHPTRRLALVGALALVLLSVLLNGLTLRHAARLRQDTRALVVARLVALGASLRRHVAPPTPGAPLDARPLHDWLDSDEAADVIALRILGRPGQRVFEWEREPGRVPFSDDAWPSRGQRRRPFLEPNELHARDGALVFRGWMPLGPPGRGAEPEPDGGPHPGPGGRIVVDLVPEAVLDLLGEGRLLVLGGGGVTLSLWAAFALLLASQRRERRLQAELVARERLAEVGRMAGVLAHQIRNPLAAIKGHAQLALERTAEGPVRRGLDHVVTESTRLEDLATRLLQYVRPLEPQRGSVEVEGLLHDLRRARPEAERIEVAIDVPEVQADRVLLREALAALLDNALRATAGGGRVVLSSRPHGDLVALAVDDDGPGLPDERVADVLRPFATGRPDGTGLGLPLAARIAEAHGGRLEVGRSPLGGAHVAVLLPHGRQGGTPR